MKPIVNEISRLTSNRRIRAVIGMLRHKLHKTDARKDYPNLDDELLLKLIETIVDSLPSDLTEEQALCWIDPNNQRFLASRLFSSLHVPKSLKVVKG